MKLIVVGSVGLDDVETPFGRRERAIGGSANFFALAASRYHAPGFVGVVGDDYPQSAIDLLAAHGVNLEGLAKQTGKTFRWAGRYGWDLNERETLATELNVFEHFNPTLPASYRDVPYVFLGNIHPALQLQVLDQVPGASFVAMDTMNYWIEGTPDLLRQVVARVHCLFVNDSEARQLSGESNLVRAARKIRDMGPQLLVIKRGEYGCLVCGEEGFFYAPAWPLEDVVDPTGAGDSFAGGFMGWVAAQGNTSWVTVCEAARVGSVTASFCVESFSVDRLVDVTEDQLAHRLAGFAGLTQLDPSR